MSVNSVAFFFFDHVDFTCNVFITITFFAPMPKTLKTFMDTDHSLVHVA